MIRPRDDFSRSREILVLSNDHSPPHSKHTLSSKVVVRLLTNNANQNCIEAATEQKLARRGPRRERGVPRSRLRRPKRSERTQAEALEDRIATIQGHSDFCVNQGHYRLQPKCLCVLQSSADPAVIVGSVILMAQHARKPRQIPSTLEARFIALVDQRNPTALIVWHWLERSSKIALTLRPRDENALPGRFPRLRVASSRRR